MAGIVFDKELKVYVPEKATCASACAFMFFAGKERKVRGQLGVHQFYSGNSNSKISVGEAEAGVQFTVSEIIGFLNEFETPRFVLERMFQQPDMYWFNQDELNQLMTSSFVISDDILDDLDLYWDTNKQKYQNKKHNLTDEEFVAFIQKRLNEIGCNAGPVDGKFGKRTASAIKRFAKKAGLTYEGDTTFAEAFIDKLSKAPKEFCPKAKIGWPNLKFASTYKLSCETDYTTVCLGDPGKWINTNYNIKNQILTFSTKTCLGTQPASFKLNQDGTYIDFGVNQTSPAFRYFINSNGYVYKFTFILSVPLFLATGTAHCEAKPS